MKPRVDYFSSEDLQHDLRGKTVRGGAWTMVGQGAVFLLQLAAIPVLTRLLTKGDFGLVTMVTFFTGFSAMFVDAGLSMATVQRDKINHQQVSNLFWLAAALGLAISLVIALSAPLVSWFYDEPRLIPITLALAITPALGGLTIQHGALLRRAMLFRQITNATIVVTALSYAVAITIAYLYRSYWALVALTVSQAVFRTLGMWIVCGWWPSWYQPGAGVRSMASFGGNLTGFSFVNYFARSGDNMLIGKVWGEDALGLYERAYKLMMAPWQQISAPLQSVIVPTLSRLNGEPDRYRRAYFQAVGVFQLVSCPLMAFVAVLAPQIVQLVFGPGYEEAGPILRWLAISGVAQPLGNSVGWLYISQGRTREMLHWGLLGASIIIASFVAGVIWGPVGVALSYAVVIWSIILPLAFWYVGARGPVSRGDLARLVVSSVAWSLPTTIASLAVVQLTTAASDLVQIAICAAASLLATATFVIGTAQGRRLFSQIWAMVMTLRRERKSPPSPPTSPKIASA